MRRKRVTLIFFIMKLRNLLLSITLCVSLTSMASDYRYVGGDISMYPTYQASGVEYKDQDGNPIDLLPYLHQIGMNAMRVRLFVDPDGYTVDMKTGQKKEDTNVCQDLPYITPLCKDIIDNGFDLMLDFHYSDTWADPEKQFIPEAWKDLSDSELVDMIYNYTKSSLEELKSEGIEPTFIQPGNEISYGMLWTAVGSVDNGGNHVYTNSSAASWARFGNLLRSAISACREVCPQAQIIIHTERVAQVNVLTNFYDKMKSLDIDYDIIGLSYYPYFHGNMPVLNSALTAVEQRYPDKPIMIVETGFPYAWEVPGTTEKVDYDYSLAGQDKYAHDLIDTLLKHPNVNGLFWWWLEYNDYGANAYNWYNAPLFDSRDGKATPALKTIASYSTAEAGIEGILEGEKSGSDKWIDLQGNKISLPKRPGVYILNGEKVMVK